MFHPMSYVIDANVSREFDPETEKEGYAFNLKVGGGASYAFSPEVWGYVLGSSYQGDNSLYKDAGGDRYLLIVSSSGHTPEEFNRLCNCLSEYGRQERHTPGGEAFWEEHCDLILKGHALQAFSQI